MCCKSIVFCKIVQKNLQNSEAADGEPCFSEGPLNFYFIFKLKGYLTNHFSHFSSVRDNFPPKSFVFSFFPSRQSVHDPLGLSRDPTRGSTPRLATGLLTTGFVQHLNKTQFFSDAAPICSCCCFPPSYLSNSCRAKWKHLSPFNLMKWSKQRFENGSTLFVRKC